MENVSSSNPSVTNCVFFDNGGSGTIYNYNSSVSASYSLFDASVTGYANGAGNRTTTTSPFASPTTTQLSACSPAIDAGTNSAPALVGITTDLAGNPRFFNNGTVDVGAYELQATASIALISQPPAGSAVCPGGSVTVSVSTTGSVTAYQWYKDGQVLSPAQPTASLTLTDVQPTDAGSYSVVVTGACNSVTSTAFSLTVNALPTVSITPSLTAVCAGQTVTLTASVASSYAWSNQTSMQAITVASGGSYSVTVTNASGCSNTATANVTVNPLPQVSISASATTLSPGQSVTLTASGASTYIWSTGATTNPITFPAGVGTTPYSVTATDGKGCSNVASVSVTGVLLPALRAPASLCVKSTGSTKTLLTLPLTMTLTGGIAPYTYNWAYKTPTSAYKPIPSGGISIGKVSLTPVSGSASLNLSGEKGNLNGLQGYVIRLTVTDKNGKTATATTLLDGGCMLPGGRQGVEEETLQVRLYPNPVVDVLQLEVSGLSQPAQVRLYDIQGRTKGEWRLVPQAGQGTLRADVSALGEGLYILRVETQDGVLHSSRVHKQR